MTNTESPKSKTKIIIISVLAIALLAISVTAYIFKDKIFGQKNIQSSNSTGQNVGSAENKLASDARKTETKSEKQLALPLFVIQGNGYDPKVMAAYEADKNPNKVYPDSIDLVKIYDQNNKELSSPKLAKDDKIIQDGGDYYIVHIEDSKKVELWSPKSNTLKTLEMPFEFDWGSFNVLSGKIYLSEFNKREDQDVQGSDPTCGEFDEVEFSGKCKVYEIDPVSLKSTVLIEGVSSAPYGGLSSSILAKNSDFIWLVGYFGDGGSSSETYYKFDANSKKLIETISIGNDFSDQSLYRTVTGKKEQKIATIQCVDEKSGDPSVSICTSKQYADFDAQVYKLIPKEFYKSQDPALEKSEKIVCGKYEVVDAPKEPAEPDNDPGKQFLYDGKSILDLKQLYIQNSICVK